MRANPHFSGSLLQMLFSCGSSKEAWGRRPCPAIRAGGILCPAVPAMTRMRKPGNEDMAPWTPLPGRIPDAEPGLAGVQRLRRSPVLGSPKAIGVLSTEKNW